MSRSQLAQRLLLGIGGVALIVWLAVSVADMNALADSGKALGTLFRPHASKARRTAALQRALAKTRQAEDLRPGDHAPLVKRAYLYAFAGRPRRALAEAERLARLEPSNRLGWLAIASITQSTDPRRAAEARARLRKLVRDPVHRRQPR